MQDQTVRDACSIWLLKDTFKKKDRQRSFIIASGATLKDTFTAKNGDVSS